MGKIIHLRTAEAISMAGKDKVLANSGDDLARCIMPARPAANWRTWMVCSLDKEAPPGL